MKVAVVPGGAAARARTLLATAGWEVEPGPQRGSDPAAALEVGGQGMAVLFVPRRARVARRLRRIVVLHEGSPAASAALEAADEAASACASEVVLLHVPMPAPAAEPGSLPAPRLADHQPYDWGEWRREFLRRFRGSPGVSLRLEVLTGPAVEVILAAARRLRPDLIVATWKGVPGPGRAERLKGVARAAPCSVLMLLEPEARPRPAQRVRPPAARPSA
jgi:nucleotide-binding universal stress UspA family protein